MHGPSPYATFQHSSHPLGALSCALQLERMGHLYAATTDTLAQVVAGLDPRTLTPYDKGDPAGIVLRIDEAVGVRPKPL